MIYDVFLAFNEIDIIRSRVAELADVPDVQHVAIEANITFRGVPKPLYLQEAGVPSERVAAFTVALPGSADPWVNERAQRNAGRSLLVQYFHPEPDDLIIISDADEIVRASAIDRIMEATDRGPVKLHMRGHFINRTWIMNSTWSAAKACRWRDCLPNMDDMRVHNYNDQWEDVYDAGWHLSWWGDEDRFHQKLSAFSHTELDTDHHHQNAVQMINTGVNFYGDYHERYNGDPDDFPKGLPLTPG